MGSPIGIRPVAPVSRMREQFIDRLRSAQVIIDTSISGFMVATDPTTKGVDVTFSLTSVTGAGTVSLLRATTKDVAQAVVLQTWNASVSTYKWSDTDADVRKAVSAFYWIRLHANTITGTDTTSAPQSVSLNPELVAPLPATNISASHGAASNGAVLVTVNVSGISVGESIRITATGYQGNSNPVAMAQRASSPLQFTMLATGETVTLTALAVSSGGTAAATGPTCTLTLTAGATAPAPPMDVTVVQIATGNQIQWPSSAEAGVTGYKVFRGQRGDTFLTATLLATVPASSTGTMEYLDTGGLSGDWQYFIETVAGSTSGPSDAANAPVLFTSAAVPPNTGVNTSNTATIDSIDAGSNALARIYGPGGVGTSYSRLTGFGSLTRPNGSISGLAYKTKYVVLYDTVAKSYVAATTYPATLPDGYEYVGAMTTTAAGGAGGSGATATAVIDAGGHVIQVNPTTNGSGYSSATVTISGGAGSGAAANANVDFFGAVTSYIVTNGGAGYTSAPAVAVTPGSGGGTTGGGTTTGNTGGSRISIPYPL